MPCPPTKALRVAHNALILHILTPLHNTNTLIPCPPKKPFASPSMPDPRTVLENSRRLRDEITRRQTLIGLFCYEMGLFCYA